MGRRDLLDAVAVEAALRVTDWRHDGDAIARTFEHRTFRDAIAFVHEVADVAEEMDHHPDIDIRWRKVILRVSTHSSGGVTQVDLDFARRVDGLRAGDGPLEVPHGPVA